MFAVRRVSFVATNFYRMNFNAIRFKSEDSKFDSNREKIQFEEKSSKKRNISATTKKQNPKFQVESEKTKKQNPKSQIESEKNEKKSNFAERKIRPEIILDGETAELENLTRQIAESLAPENANDERKNIEKDLLDVLRGHRVVSKTTRRNETKPKFNVDREKTQKSTQNKNIPDAFSSLLRDINLQTSRSQVDSKENIDSLSNENVSRSKFDEIEDRRATNRRTGRDSKRRQEFQRPHQLWTNEPLGIFEAQNLTDSSKNSSPIWTKAEEEDLKRVSTVPPRNAFEEMIQWTKDGILWKFPVDNEQDVGAEAEVPFYDHVLLERHLHDFPPNPLIRQFMELVCIGLGRNSHWTAAQKLEHINWFRTYFTEKINVFSETVHTGAVKSASSTSTKPVSTFKPKPTPISTPKPAPVATPPVAKK